MSVELEFEKKSKVLLALSDSWQMIKRSSLHILRNTDQLLGAFFQPIMFLILFASVFGGSLEYALPPGISYINYLMPGIIVQTVAFGSTTTAVSIANDMQKGIIDRFRSLPMSNLAVLTGHVVSDIMRNAISTTVMVVTGLIIGFSAEANFNQWLQIIGVLVLFTLAFSWLSAIAGVVAKSVEAVQWLTFIFIFPLTFASSAFTPTDGMSKYLRIFAENQPITQVVNAVRALMLGQPVGDYLWKSIAWCLLTLVIAIPLAAYFFKKKNST